MLPTSARRRRLKSIDASEPNWAVAGGRLAGQVTLLLRFFGAEVAFLPQELPFSPGLEENCKAQGPVHFSARADEIHEKSLPENMDLAFRVGLCRSPGPVWRGLANTKNAIKCEPNCISWVSSEPVGLEGVVGG